MSTHRNLLVIDDEPVLLDAVRKIGQPEGWNVDTASTTAEGLAQLVQAPHALVLTDLMLPGDGGLRVLAAARSLAEPPPVVVTTGYATRDRITDCFRYGAFDVLPKPFDVFELLAVVRRALEYAMAPRFSGRLAGRSEDPPHGSGSPRAPALYRLGLHSWARPEPNGAARIGLGESFRALRRGIRTVELPTNEDEVAQGDECARITMQDGLVHRVWSPLSGRVTETRPACKSELAVAGSLAERWLLIAVPSDMESELERLTTR